LTPLIDAADGADHFDALTKRQQQIAALVCRGHPNKVIARELTLTDGTVKQHVYRIFRKLGVRNRRELIAALSPPASTCAKAGG